MSLDLLSNVDRLRVENELNALEELDAKPTTSALVQTRWERKAAKKPKLGTGVGETCGSGNLSSSDRFIPSRAINHDLQQCNLQLPETNENTPCTGELPSVKMLKGQLFEGQTDSKILAFKEKPKPADAGYLNHLRVLYSQTNFPAHGAANSLKRAHRAIATTAERVLDAPDLVDDFYLNLLDWSSQNILAVALGQSVYLWNATSCEIELLMELSDSVHNTICSLSWSADGNFLAIGTACNEVQLWSATAKKQLRSMRGHQARVGALAWNGHTLTSGSRDSSIFNHDVRIAQHHVASLNGHSLEVCGLKWSEDGAELASGGNDNICCIWDASMSGSSSSSVGASSGIRNQTPRLVLGQHSSAVKALAWCPYQRHVLATGSGSADRHIRLFNSQTGAMLSATDTDSQVSSLFFGRRDHEIISAQCYSQNQLTVWRVPSSGPLQRITDLTGHSGRILHMALSPDGTTVCSAAADETLRFWKVWDAAPDAKSCANGSMKTGSVSAPIAIR